jgi:hypothetical protein
MDAVMIQLSLAGQPTLAEAAQTLGVDLADLDPDFGVIPTDPDNGLYTVRVSAEAAPRAQRALERRGIGGAEGVFSDPRIAPFGPPED